MMDSLFGGEGGSLAVRFFIAFVVVFALIGVTAWLIRRFGSGALSGAGARGRAPRLAVIEAGAVDGRRKLVLIRRDNVEHLIMIGGPSDIVVEANILRGQNARDNASSRTSAAAETLPRAVPLDEPAWPAQPEPAQRPTRAATRPAPLEDTTAWSLQPELTPPSPPIAPPAPAPAKSRSRASDALAGLAAELNVRPAEPVAPMPPATPAPRAPSIETPRPAARPAPAAAAADSNSADNNLADMASRLEAALKRPAPAPAPRPAAPAPRAAPSVAVTPPPARTPEIAPTIAPPIAEKAPEPAPVSEKPAEKSVDNIFGSIEEEMANLLGRPGGKS